MRYMPIITTLVVCLMAQPAFASSTQFPQPSGTFCDTRSPGNCYTTNINDSYNQIVAPPSANSNSGIYHTGYRTYSLVAPNDCWYMYSSEAVWKAYGSPSSSRICVRYGAYAVGHEYQQYYYPDIPEQDKDHIPPFRKMTISQHWVNFNIVRERISVEIRLDNGSAYCDFYNAKNDEADRIKNVALDRTPDSVMNGCGFTMRRAEYLQQQQQNQEQPQEPVVDTTSSEQLPETSFVVPRSATKCGAVRNGTERVTVRATKYNCRTAKSVVQSYARTFRSPRGWSCAARMNDSKITARCEKKTTKRARATAAAYGIWVRH